MAQAMETRLGANSRRPGTAPRRRIMTLNGHCPPPSAAANIVPRILIVDDDPAILKILSHLLSSEGYQVDTAANGYAALDKIPHGVDLVLSDIMMPGMDGHALTSRIRATEATNQLPLIMITSLDTPEERLRAVDEGANDFIGKPISARELCARVRAQLRMKGTLDAIKRHEAELERTVDERTRALQTSAAQLSQQETATRAAHLETIQRLVMAAEFKDSATADHILRMGRISKLLAARLGIPPDDCETILHASPMHDVGKIGIPESILLKTCDLDWDEWAVMRRHTTIGAKILAGSKSECIRMAETIAISHHERWNGLGYPNGIGGRDIPTVGRICAVTDVYDVLVSHRPYKRAYSIEKALGIMRAGRGTQFDPVILEAFLDNHREIEALRIGS